jgi:ABC-type multidrug transport system fused ATPase/permease subunit
MQRMRLIAHLYEASLNSRVSMIARYGLAFVSDALALGVGLLLRGFPFTLFLMDIAITAWYGRMGAGLRAILLSMLSLIISLVPNITHFRYFTVFTSFALVISWLSTSRRRAEQALQEARCELEAKVAEQTAELRRTTSEAIAAQERFRDLVNSVEGVVWEDDAETFTFSLVSDQAEHILRYPTPTWLEPGF